MWPKYLQSACNVINNTVNHLSKVTPSEIIFGRDTSALANFNWKHDDSPVNDFISEMRAVQQWAMSQAKLLKTRYDEEMQRIYNEKHKARAIPENATVYWRRPSLPDPHSNKKLQCHTNKYQAFDIRNQSCQLRDASTGKVHRTRVSLSQLVFPSKHEDNVKLLKA